MTEGGLPAPITEGTLATRPFAHVLLHVHQQELSGTLVVWPEQTGEAAPGQDRILVSRGTPIAGRFLSPASTLERGMLPLFKRVNAPFAFYAANLVGSGESVSTGEIDPIALITASLRGSAREDAIEAVIARFGDERLRLTPRVSLDRYGFDTKENAFLDLVRAAPDTAQMLCATWGDARQARRLLYLLAITKSIEVWTGEKKKSTGGGIATQRLARSTPAALPRADVVVRVQETKREDEFAEVAPERPASMPPAQSSRPPSARSARASGPPGRRGAGPEAPPPAPEGLSQEHAKLWQEITLRAKRVESMNYFEMLGVGRDCSANDVRDAYFALAKKWHPDRLPPELSQLRPWVDVIFHHATQARDTLSDDRPRAEYWRSVQAGGGTPESDRQLNAIVDAAMAVQKVEVLVRRREWAESLSLLREAIELNREDADAHAMQGWVLLQMGIAKNQIDFDAVYSALDRALSLNERSARAHLYKATALKRQKKEHLALTHYRKVAELDPKNIDAQREVRLAEMRGHGGQKRRRSSPPSKQDGGLLGKLFGSGKKK
jgi:hypothetical protein